MDYSNSEEKLTSQYNEAMFQISRLHNIWLESKGLREKGNLIAYRWKLDSAEIELWTDVIRLDEEKGFKQKIGGINLKIKEAIIKRDYSNLYKTLIEKEKILKEIQEAAGKGAKFSHEDDDMM